jgi:hypothetical protein
VENEDGGVLVFVVGREEGRNSIGIAATSAGGKAGPVGTFTAKEWSGVFTALSMAGERLPKFPKGDAITISTGSAMSVILDYQSSPKKRLGFYFPEDVNGNSAVVTFTGADIEKFVEAVQKVTKWMVEVEKEEPSCT